MIRALVVVPPLPGFDLGTHLAPLADGPRRAEVRNGVTVDVHPVALREDRSVVIPLGSMGSFELGADGGDVVVVAPLMIALILRQQVAARVVREEGLMQRRMVLRASPGDAVSFEIPGVARFAIELVR